MPREPIPTEREAQARFSRWLVYFVDKLGQTAVAEQTALSLAHVSNLYNHPDTHRPSLKVILGMCYGLDVTLRELFREEPPAREHAPRLTREHAQRLTTTRTKGRG